MFCTEYYCLEEYCDSSALEVVVHQLWRWRSLECRSYGVGLAGTPTGKTRLEMVSGR